MDIRHDQLTRITELSSHGRYRGAAARLENARGLRLHLESGSVWVTQECCTDDVLLHAGATYAIEHRGVTVVSSPGRRFALVTVESLAPAKPKTSFLERLADFWCRLYADPMPAPRPYL